MINRFPVPQDVQDNPYFWKHVGDEMAYSPEFSKVQQAIRVWHMEYQNRDQLIVCEVCGGNGYWRPTVGAHWCIDGGHPARKRNNRKVAS
jgi:hypothetical protein